jgi:predicted outer membrane repeat protein
MSTPNCLVPGALLALLSASIAGAATISVGPSGCNTTSLQTAINSLSGSPDTSYTIKLKAGTIAIPSGVSMNVPASDIDIIGGFASCNDASPTAGLRSTLDASGGGDGTTMTIDAGNRSTQQWITFRNATVRGGSSETAPLSNPEGGGLEVRGHARVWLRDDTRVEDNASGKGAGVYLNGATSTRPAELYILDGSSISNNVAITLGGGVYCNNFGAIQFYDGQISFNDANNGGAIYLNPGCRLEGIGTGSGNLKSIDNNRALINGSTGGYGGAIYLSPDGAIANPIHLVGDPGNPILFLNNSATYGGGLYALNNSATRVSLDFINTIWLGHRATQGAGMLMGGRFNTSIEAQPGCTYSFFGASGCSAFDDNDASDGAGAIRMDTGATTGALAQLSIKRTRFENNAGAPAIASMGYATLTMEGSVIRNNLSLSSGFAPFERTLFGFAGGVAQSVRYSTILANNTDNIFSSYVSAAPGSALNVVGTIVWAPGTLIWRNWDNGPSTIEHDGCLIGHSGSGLPAGVIVADPMLESDLTPGVASPALDVCGIVGGAPSQDFHGQARGFDQPAIPNLYGPNDLGAVERRTAIDDTIFRNGFEIP